MKNSRPNDCTTAARRGSDSLEQEVFLSLWRTYDRLKSFEDDLFSQVGLSAQQYNALRLLRSVSPDSMATLDLGRRLISRAPDMTRMLDRLEQLGLLTRERKSENRRVVAVKITRQGLKLLDEVQNAVLECHRHQLGHLDHKSLHQLAKLLRAARLPHEDTDSPCFVDE